MARPASATIGESWRDSEHQMQGFSFEELPDGTIEVPNMVGGMVSSFPRDEVPQNAAEEIVNARVRSKKVIRRGGTSELGTKPDSDRVLSVLLYLQPRTRNPWIIRVTRNAIYGTNTDDAWYAFTGRVTGPKIVELSSSAYSHPDGVAHQDSRWQVREVGASDWSSPVYDSGWTTEDLEEHTTDTIPHGDHEARVAHRDTNNNLAWSTPKTIGNVQEAVLPKDLAKVDSTQLLDKLYLADGSNRILELSVPQTAFEVIGSAPRANYVEAFGDRLVAAGIDGEPSTIRWSGILEPEKWNPRKEETAGFAELSGTPSHRGDPITGLQVLGERLIIFRERSIWEAQRQAVPTAPFRFREITSDLGCDMPHTISFAEGRIVFASHEYNGVFVLRPGSRPQRVSGPVADDLETDLQSLESAEAAYDPFNQEYHLGLETDSSKEDIITKTWVWSLKNNTWSYDDSPDVTAIGRVVGLTNITTIDELGSTVIDNLTGVIDDLSAEPLGTPEIMKGTDSGEVIFYDLTKIDDYDASNFETLWQSPNLGSISRRRTMLDHLLHYESSVAGTIVLENSKDGDTWENAKTISVGSGDDKRKDGLRRAQITGDDLYWRLRTSSVDIALLNYWIRVMEKGVQHSP